jgi:small subunit ribosomal protein S4
MGDPKKLRKKYATPIHPWNKDIIERDRIIRQDYGLRNRKEILIVNSFLKKYKNIAKRLIASQTTQGEKEKEQIMNKLQGLGLLPAGAQLDQILGLEVKDILERRLQSIIFRKGLSKTMKQARQFIVHRHIRINDKEITFPSYLVSLEEEAGLVFKPKSPLADEEHPERVNVAKEVAEEVKAVKGVENEEDEKFMESVVNPESPVEIKKVPAEENEPVVIDNKKVVEEVSK